MNRKAITAEMRGETAKTTEGMIGINDIMFGAMKVIPTNLFGIIFCEVLLAKQKHIARNTFKRKD